MKRDASFTTTWLDTFRSERRHSDVLLLEDDRGRYFSVSSPEHWNPIVKGEGVGAARTLVDDYEEFRAGGGSVLILVSVIEEWLGCAFDDILTVLELLVEHGEAIEADLLRYYHLDLLDLGRRRLSWRRLRSLIRYLPAESATARAMHGDTADWGLAEHLLASVVDVLQVANWQRAADKRAQRPEPLERPGVKRVEPRRSQLSDAEKLQRLKAMNADRREG